MGKAPNNAGQRPRKKPAADELPGDTMARLAAPYKPTIEEVRQAIYGRDNDGAAMPPEALLETMAKLVAELRAHPDTIAKDCIEAHLQAAHLDARLRQSPELSRFVSLMRDLLHEAWPGQTVEHIVAPLNSLLGIAAGKAGGIRAAGVTAKKEARNQLAVKEAFLSLSPHLQQQRNAVSAILNVFKKEVSPLRMNKGTVQKHLTTLGFRNKGD